jgi:hypothetical protein
MKLRRLLLVSALVFLIVARLAPGARSVVPESLTNEQFWVLSTELSESGGTFRSDNLLSNERRMQHVIPDLTRAIKPGSAYLGVGPEQNFTYIAALRPAMAFIVDIRRGNLQLHLMYKALFELSSDRADFVSRLFSRKRVTGLARTASAQELFNAYMAEEGDPALFAMNLVAMREHLTRTRELPLGVDDIRGIAWISQAFFSEGPFITYRANFGGIPGFPTYSELMSSTDAAGTARSYLASEEAFAFLKGLHVRNLIVPVVGDFAGPKAIRSVARYLKEKQATVGVFYLSNVEQYLGREGRWQLFCENVASLPLDETSSFIRSVRDMTSFGLGPNLNSVTGNMLSETRHCTR